MKAQVQSFEVRAMPLIVLVVSALLLLWAWAGAFVLLNPNTVDLAMRWGGLPMLFLFGGLFLASLVTLFNHRIRVDHVGVTILLPYGGSVTYGRDEIDVSIRGRIIRLGPVSGAKFDWRRFFITQKWVNVYLLIKRKEFADTSA